MARRYRRRKAYRRPRRFRRRRTVARKAIRIARSVSRKMAGEVRKYDLTRIIPENSFTQLTAAVGSALDNAQSLPDFGYLYNVFETSVTSDPSSQGFKIEDFTGNQIRAKYVYLGIHLQMPVRVSGSSANTIQQPVCIRCMVVQDRNYTQGLPTIQAMCTQLFGVSATGANSSGGTYNQAADFTLLPINPQQPGRFKVIRDFKMNVAPGYRMDYYKKIMLLQRDLFSSGRFYAGNDDYSSATAPADLTSSWNNMRNRIYVLLLYQSPTLYTTSGTQAGGSPDFTVTIQSRLAFYDN